MRRVTLWLWLALMLLAGTALVSAQDELLRNPGLDEGSFGPYTTRRGGTFPIYLPEGWNVWLAQPSGDFYNRADRTTIQPHPGPGPSPVEGNRALSVNCGYVTCTAAIYQQVAVQQNSNVQARAWAQVKVCNIAPNADNCGSAVESGAQTRIGIDPNGGTDPNDSDIVWSNWSQPHDTWLEMSVSATTTGTTATLFLYSTQANPGDLNRTYWDGASLKGGGTGGSAAGAATPIPTAPPEVPFVVPQNQRPDGSIVHTVQAGDTIDSIAVAYGLTRSDILALNPSITDPRIIRLGQEIVIRQAQAAPPATPTQASASDATQLPSSGINLEEVVTEEAIESAGTDTPPQDTGSDPAVAPEMEATATPPVVTLTPAPVVMAPEITSASSLTSLAATVCVLMFEDTNQNRIQEPNETLLPGGSIVLNAPSGTVGSVETDGVSEPHCFEEVAAGSYIAAARPPANYGLTSPDQLRLRAVAGTRLDVAFGAAAGVVAAAPPPADTGALVDEIVAQDAEQSASPLQDILAVSGLVVFGLAGLVLVAGTGLTLFMRGR
jgi:LysM repeat protein